MEDDPVRMVFKGAGFMLLFLRKAKGHEDVSIEKKMILGDESYRLMRIHHHLSEDGMERALDAVGSVQEPEDSMEKIVYKSLTWIMERLERPKAVLGEMERRGNEILA